jgi:hypothetical protein
LNEAGTRASVLGVLVLPEGDAPPEGAAPPLALVELPDGEAPPLALVDVVAGCEVEVDVEVAAAVEVPVVEVEAGAVDVLGELAALIEVLECEEPPHPAMTRKAARSTENAARRLTFPA